MRIRSCFLLALLLGWGHRLSADVLYSVTDLGTLGGTSSGGNGINNAGQVVGSSSTSTGASSAFVYSNGQMKDLGPGEAHGINSAGQIVGTNDGHAFLYGNGQMTNLGSFFAYEINDAGQIVGETNGHAVLYSNGQMIDLGSVIPGDSRSRAFGINNAGQVVGTSGDNAFLYSNGQFMFLPATSDGRAINNKGQATGVFLLPPSPPPGPSDGHAFLYSDGQFTDLGSLFPRGFPSGTFTTGRAINEDGEIVGDSASRSGGIAFLYSNGQLSNLNNFIDPALGIMLTVANGVNDNGQIAANGYYHDDFRSPRAFLLTPIPEPSTLTLFGLALLGLAGWSFRYRSCMSCGCGSE